MNIRWKLFTTYLLVILLTILVLGVYLNHELSQHYLNAITANLLSQAKLIRDAAAADFSPPPQSDRLQDYATRLGKEARIRITFIAREGTVLGDTDQNPRKMENHATRPEVKQAMLLGEGRSIRYSQTLHEDMLYVALSVKQKGAVMGVVRVATPLAQISAALARIHRALLYGGLLALVLALLLSARLSRGLNRDIQSLSKAARLFADGNLAAKARVGNSGELGLLADSFNVMAARLSNMISDIKEEKRKSAVILERITEAILVTDQDGNINYCNPETEKVLGVERDKLLGVSLNIATQNYALDDLLRKAIRTGETTSAEIQISFPRPRIVEATVAPLTTEQPLGAVAILHDITELRRLEGIRKEFVANASHELQTPITAIKAMVETLLTSGKDDAELTERFLRDTERQAERMGALVRDLLDLANIEAGPAQPEVADIEVIESARTVIKQFESLARQRNISISLEIKEGVMVRAESAALHRILSNLLDNALKYTEPGGKCGLRAAPRNNDIAITVWDTGLGIPSTDQPHIFERFYRVDKARSRDLGGTGLGLAIVKHLVESLGGRIELESFLGKGSLFTILLPAGERDGK